jgi:signal transduction histidine kinase
VTTAAPAERPSAPMWRLRSRLGRSFLVLAILLVLLSVAVIVSTVRFADAGTETIDVWQPAVATSDRALADLVNQETGVRGFLLTEQRASLRPWRRYTAAYRRDRATLDRLVGRYPDLRALLTGFERRAQLWRSTVAIPAIRDAERGRQPGTGALDAGRSAFNRIRAASARLTDGITHRAAGARATRRRWELAAGIAIGLAILVLLVTGYWLWRGLHRWVLRPVERLGEQTRHVADGQLRHRIVPYGPAEFVDLGTDVEFMRSQIVEQLARAEEIQEELRRQSAELERSNADLQQFAYVASHDLSEPLRKVSNFCQLLERQYGEQLDDRAKQYIFFAVDGAKRMQTLITDLLALSRVGRTTEAFVPVALDDVIDRMRATLAERIADTGAQLDVLTALPTVQGDASLLTSLFENLVGNALKYRREGVPPHVRISAERHDGDEWLFTVADNGIGIESKYADRIFAVFQRLHLRDQYGGTGIGLALCRKIVEFHGGTIWLAVPDDGDVTDGDDDVDSVVNGATFRFTLPTEGGARAESRP